MKVSTATHEFAVQVIALSGRLDALEAGPLRELLSSFLDSGKHNLIVDLADVEFVDSAGLAALVKAMKDARLAGGDVRLVSPGAADALRVFTLTRFDQVFIMADSADELIGNW